MAEALEKRPSEISKWLNGHNLTIRTLAKLEAALGEELLVVTKPSNNSSNFLPLYIGHMEVSKVNKANELDAPNYKNEVFTKQYLKIA